MFENSDKIANSSTAAFVRSAKTVENVAHMGEIISGTGIILLQHNHDEVFNVCVHKAKLAALQREKDEFRLEQDIAAWKAERKAFT